MAALFLPAEFNRFANCSYPKRQHPIEGAYDYDESIKR
jgi:hypothetical protein